MSSSLMSSSSASVDPRDGTAAARSPDADHDEEDSLPIACLAACRAAMMASVWSMTGSDAEISDLRAREARPSMREILRFTGDCSTARAPGWSYRGSRSPVAVPRQHRSKWAGSSSSPTTSTPSTTTPSTSTPSTSRASSTTSRASAWSAAPLAKPSSLSSMSACKWCLHSAKRYECSSDK
eukprot:scaffold20620_cov74-Phaeocystis_antarctica.AAC.5